MRKPLSHMTPLQLFTAKQKVLRINRINEYYRENPGCTVNQAVSFIPESAALVQQYSKLRTELIIKGNQAEITPKDIVEYVYGKNPSRHKHGSK